VWAVSNLGRRDLTSSPRKFGMSPPDLRAATGKGHASRAQNRWTRRQGWDILPLSSEDRDLRQFSRSDEPPDLAYDRSRHLTFGGACVTVLASYSTPTMSKLPNAHSLGCRNARGKFFLVRSMNCMWHHYSVRLQ